MARRPARAIYDDFVRKHYVGKPLRDSTHIQALLEAAGMRGNHVKSDFWDSLRPEWVWAVSPLPFSGPKSRRANAQYRRLCELSGIAP
jgi:hypothetical protein